MQVTRWMIPYIGKANKFRICCLWVVWDWCSLELFAAVQRKPKKRFSWNTLQWRSANWVELRFLRIVTHLEIAQGSSPLANSAIANFPVHYGRKETDKEFEIDKIDVIPAPKIFAYRIIGTTFVSVISNFSIYTSYSQSTYTLTTSSFRYKIDRDGVPWRRTSAATLHQLCGAHNFFISFTLSPK